MTTPHPLESRFWKYAAVGDPSECWSWRGEKNHKGYARIYDGGATRPASRIAWEIATGQPFPDGKLACHSCDNPGCVNPVHIWPGTAKANSDDARRKGRLVRPPARPRQICCPSCGHTWTRSVAPRGSRTTADYPSPQGQYAEWATRRAIKEYRCVNDAAGAPECQHVISEGSLYAHFRTFGLANGPRKDLRACAGCAGLQEQSS